MNGFLQISAVLLVLLLLVRPLGRYMSRVYQGEPVFLSRILGPIERLVYRLVGVKPTEEMGWKTYAGAMLLFNLLGMLVMYLLLRLQALLPLNPQGIAAFRPDLAFNTAVSFTTNTNWQNYGGETGMSYLIQMLGPTAQNFISAGTGMAVLAAFIRGFSRQSSKTLGSFWVDFTRTNLYILLPLAVLFSLALVSQGVVQTFSPSRSVPLLQPTVDVDGNAVEAQVIALGPAASQIAIKQLGSNGGGYFSVNSAHPFENPTPLSNFLEMIAIVLIPAALCITFGEMVGDARQGWALLSVMLVLLCASLLGAYAAESAGNPQLDLLGVDQKASELNPGGNMEGKEVRFGVPNSAAWAVITTASSNGSVNSMLNSFTPLGGLVLLLLMQTGEVVFGGVGSGLYGMLAFVILAVFVAGLMVGRTPEYLGKKIEIFEMKMASLLILIMPIIVLGFTALAVSSQAGKSAALNPGPHGFSEILYAFTSQGNNNGSAFAGLSGDSLFYNLTGGLAMLLSRYWLAIPTLALAGALARKKKVPASAGTLPTHTPLFAAWLIGIVLLVAALNFIPALALGPVIEHLLLSF